ncbi:MAG: glycosyltransferase family 4 protein [Burkholderiales bacterium]
MRIALVAPLFESVPPRLYGGTERIVSYLAEELVGQGHDVTLFASGDSVTRARLVPCVPHSLRLESSCQDALAYHIIMLDRVFEMAPAFDVIHFNIDYLHFPLSRLSGVPQVSTLHGRLDLLELVPLYERFHKMPLVSISDNQRTPLPRANWLGTVYHGIPNDLYELRETHGEYLAFLGRISPEKRPDRAIEIARRCGINLRIAAKVDRVDQAYFKERIEPLLHDPLIEYVGEIGEREKREFLGNARALLFPIDWPEPFGLAIIEAMACGTPTIAYRCGSVPEVLADGVNGYIVDNESEAVAAVERIEQFDRRRCREAFEQRFTVARMAQDYVAVYRKICKGRAPPLQVIGAV